MPTSIGGASGNPLSAPAVLIMTFAALGLVFLTVGALLNEIRDLLLAGAFLLIYRQFSGQQEAAVAATTSLIASIIVAVVVAVDVVMRLVGGSAARTYLADPQLVLTVGFYAAIIAVALAVPKPRQAWNWLLAIGAGIALARAVEIHVWSGYPIVLMDFVFVVYLVAVLAAGVLMYHQRPASDSPE
jgi:hypothetical protein